MKPEYLHIELLLQLGMIYKSNEVFSFDNFGILWKIKNEPVGYYFAPTDLSGCDQESVKQKKLEIST